MEKSKTSMGTSFSSQENFYSGCCSNCYYNYSKLGLYVKWHI